ncbi:MAG: ABC transporter ATP-binding protein [Acidimicrobiaceae bacterium]|nr:ABC transporter ATP-binding protein [Acidimicrobiaceae bacterium]
MSDAPLLSAVGLTKNFGGFRALDDVSLDLYPGEAVGLVGPNGSGKTTFINVVSGVYTASAGTIKLRGLPIEGLPPHRRARLGLGRTFQVPKPLGNLTVLENVQVALQHSKSAKSGDADPLEFAGLAKFANRRANSLTTMEQKRLDLARVLALSPAVVLVDEFAAGLSPSELIDIASLLNELRGKGMALVVVEHLLGFLEAVVDRVLVLDAGREIFSGGLKEAFSDDKVVEVFLGQ